MKTESTTAAPHRAGRVGLGECRGLPAARGDPPASRGAPPRARGEAAAKRPLPLRGVAPGRGEPESATWRGLIPVITCRHAGRQSQSPPAGDRAGAGRARAGTLFPTPDARAASRAHRSAGARGGAVFVRRGRRGVHARAGRRGAAGS